jgi:hypothetical protein
LFVLNCHAKQLSSLCLYFFLHGDYLETFSKCLSEHSLTGKWSCWNITYIKPIFNKQQKYFAQLFPIYSWALQFFWQKNICTKGACKMWVILTKGHTETRSYRNKVLPEQSLTFLFPDKGIATSVVIGTEAL